VYSAWGWYIKVTYNSGDYNPNISKFQWFQHGLHHWGDPNQSEISNANLNW